MEDMNASEEELEIAKGEGRAEIARIVWDVIRADTTSANKLIALAGILEPYRPESILPLHDGPTCEWCSKPIDAPDNNICPHCDRYWSDWVGEMDATVILEG